MKMNRKYIPNIEPSVIGVPIFGQNESGRSNHDSFLMILQNGKNTIIAVSKNPDRRFHELKAEYGNQIKHISSRRSFSAYEDKKKLHNYFKRYQVGNKNSYNVSTKDIEKAIKELNLRSPIIFVEE